MLLRFSILVIFFVVFGMSAHAEQSAAPKSLGAYGAWTAFSMKEGGQPVCYMVAKAPVVKNKKSRRGAAWLTITQRPGENSKDVISYTAGYNYEASSDVTVRIGKEDFERSVGYVDSRRSEKIDPQHNRGILQLYVTDNELRTRDDLCADLKLLKLMNVGIELLSGRPVGCHGLIVLEKLLGDAQSIRCPFRDSRTLSAGIDNSRDLSAIELYGKKQMLAPGLTGANCGVRSGPRRSCYAGPSLVKCHALMR